MTLEIVEEPATSENLEAHGSISIAFRVDSRLRVDLVEQGLGGISLSLEPVNSPYMKDYDADEDGRPSRWAERWDISRWGILAAYEGERRTGGAVLAFDTADVWFLDGRKDVAALWDIRVAPEHRRSGVGRALFDAAVDWARKRDCRLLKIETQNVNVGACRFYAAMGCQLGAVNRFAYRGSYGAAHPDEVQLVWVLELDS